MKTFDLAKVVLSRMDPETAHDLAMKCLRWTNPLRKRVQYNSPVSVMGITFPNPVGLAAGFDKNGDYINCLDKLGFGFIEVGTVTPLPQKGNPRPRLFRTPEAGAIINRMGFNNYGAVNLCENLRKADPRIIVGVSIGRNACTPQEDSLRDYKWCMDRVYDKCSYIVANISSPNTRDLRKLENLNNIETFVRELWCRRFCLCERYSKKKPLIIKISPDLTEYHLKKITDILLYYGIDGVIATNTTVSRFGVESYRESMQAGGMSGAPLKELSLRTIRILNEHSGGEIPIIASGGIMSADDALEMMGAGAILVQIFTGFVYNGPRLIRDINALFCDN